MFRDYIEENFKKGYIRPLQSLIGYPILFISKKDGKLYLYVDYKQFNAIIIKNCYFLPFVTELKD